MKNKDTFNLAYAKKILASLMVNTNEYPEAFRGVGEYDAKTCERNMLIAKAIMAIDEVKEGL